LRVEEKVMAKGDNVANAEMSPIGKSNASPTLKVERSVGYERTPVAIGRLPATCWMDAAAVRGRTLIVRGWQSGDWMRPCGFPHRRKLQDIFVTAKVPPAVRRSLPVVADAETGEVLWIPGYRVSEAVKVPSATAPSLKFAFEV
jgi:tRNA(Ile)-lysidine synthetase-like protein